MTRATLSSSQQKQRNRENRAKLQRATYGYVPERPPVFALPDEDAWPLPPVLLKAVANRTAVGIPRPLDYPAIKAYRQLQADGWPQPTCEHQFFEGRRWSFDFSWPDRMIALEIEGFGGRHQTVAGMTADAEKYNVAAARGWIVLRATTKMVQEGSMLAALRMAWPMGGVAAKVIARLA